MSDLRSVLHDAAARPTTGLDVAATVRAGLRRRRNRRGAGAAASVVLLAVVATVAVISTRPPEPRPPVTTGLEDLPVGWSDLPPPPQGLAAGALAWTGQELITWSGDDIKAPGDAGNESDAGYRFDPRTSTWRPLPTAPISGREFPASAWTGTELVVWGGEGPAGQAPVDGAAYDPKTDSWRRLPDAPLRMRTHFSAWTGDELLIWGDSDSRPGTGQVGLGYDPARNAWRKIAAPPLEARANTAGWTGDRVVAVGRPLNAPAECAGGSAECPPPAVSAAYDPDTDRWTNLEPPGLYATASTVLAVGDDVVAWDYGHATTVLDADLWRVGPKAPLRFSECYPMSVAARTFGLGLYCGQTVLYDAGSGTWRDVSDHVNQGVHLFGVAAGDVMLLVGGRADGDGGGVLRAFRPPTVTSQECDPVQFEPAESNRRAESIVAVDVDCAVARRVAAQSETAVGGSYLAEGFSCPAGAEDVRPSRFVYQCSSGDDIVKFTSLPYPAPHPALPADARIVAPLPMNIEVTDDFGLVTAVRDTSAGWEIDVDRVAMLSGDEAEEAAAANRDTVSNDYYLVNDDPTVRTYRVADDCVVWGSIVLGRSGGEPKRVDLDTWREFLDTPAARTTLFHFVVDGGTVRAVEEQYRP